MKKADKIFTRKNIVYFTFVIYILAILIFDIFYCNFNYLNNINSDKNINYNVSYCRIVMYIIFLTLLFIFRNKISDNIEGYNRNQYKRIAILLYTIILVLIMIVGIFIVLKDLSLAKIISVGLITALMTEVFLIYVSNNIIKNVVITIFSLGLVFTIATDFNHALDEKKHFMTAFNIAFGNFDYEKKPITDVKVNELPQLSKFTTVDNFLSEQYVPNITDDVNMDDVPSTPAPYSFVTYLFSALGIEIGKTLGGSIIDIYILGRIFNLIEYCILICIALKLMPCKKNIMVVIFLLPISLLLAASYSIDGFCIGVVAIFIAYCLKLSKETKTISMKDFIILLLLFSLTLFAKSMAYIAIAVIFLLLPIKETIKKNKKYLPWMIAGLLIILSILVLMAIKIKNTKVVSDARATGDINVSQQLEIILKYPIFDIKLIINHIKQTLLNFNWYALLHDGTFFEKDSQWVFILLFLFVLYTSLTEDDNNFNIKEKIIMIAAFMCVYMITSLVLYLSFTQLWALHIAGYQTRYILPVLPLLLISIPNNRVKCINNANRNLIISMMSAAFIFIGIAQNILY